MYKRQSQPIKDGIAASNKKSGSKPGQLDKMSDALREDILKYLSDRSIKPVSYTHLCLARVI